MNRRTPEKSRSEARLPAMAVAIFLNRILSFGKIVPNDWQGVDEVEGWSVMKEVYKLVIAEIQFLPCGVYERLRFGWLSMYRRRSSFVMMTP